LIFGYRFFPVRWLALVPEAGTHAHLYDGGRAAVPYLGLQVRLMGTM
jgi:hypothetical protein